MTTNSSHTDKHAEHPGNSGCCGGKTQTASPVPEKTQRPEPTEAKPSSDQHGCCESDH